MRQRTRMLAAAVFLAGTGIFAAPQVATATTLSISEQAQAFATCAGRLSALATRQRATHDPKAQRTDRLGADFRNLLDAALPHALDAGMTRTQPRQWQIDGWLEIAHLLRVRHYSADVTRAARAEADLHRRILTCERMILAG